MPKETKKERINRVIKEVFPRMIAIAKIEVLFDQIEQLLPLTDSQTLKEDMILRIARSA